MRLAGWESVNVTCLASEGYVRRHISFTMRGAGANVMRSRLRLTCSKVLVSRWITIGFRSTPTTG